MPIKFVGLNIIFPEDLGGHCIHGPSSMWVPREFRFLQGVRDARRAAAYLCQFTRSEYKRPIGILSNCTSFRPLLFLGWPNLVEVQNRLKYKGPLPLSCSCGRAHTPLIGLVNDATFRTSSSVGFGAGFWISCVYDDMLERSFVSLRDGRFSAPLAFVSLRFDVATVHVRSMESWYAYEVRFVLLWAPLLARVCARSGRCPGFRLLLLFRSALLLALLPRLQRSVHCARSRSLCRMKKPLVLLRPRGRCFIRGGITGDVQLRATTTGTQDLSALGESFGHTPLVVPIRGHLDSIKRLLRGDLYIGRGSRQRSLPKSRYCNTFKVSQVGRSLAILSFREALLADPVLLNSLWTLSGTRLVCHCRATEDCHGDVLIEQFRKLYPAAHDRNQPCGVPPGHEILSFLARLREEPESDEGSSPDEGVPDKFAGHRGNGPPMKVGVGYVQREFCDGQSLASPGRWSPEARVYPSSPAWSSVRECIWRFTAHYGTEKLLVDLAMGKVEESPFPPDEVLRLKSTVIDAAGRAGIHILRKSGDRVDVPIDYRFLDVLLRAAEEPEVGLGEYAQGVKVGPGTRMPRLPALYKPKRKWRLPSQVDPLDYLEYAPDKSGVWRRNYATLREFETQVLDVMHDQASRGQIIVMTESEARSKYPDLVIASLGAQRKEKPGEKVTARVLFDGTHGLCVNTKTRLRDQERAPIASDLKRSMREKSKIGELTFALSADVTEAHRQVPIHPDDWHLLGRQVSPGGDVFVNTVGTFGIASASYYWSRVAAAVDRLVQYLSAYTSTSWHMLVADNFLLESGGPEYRTGLLLFFVLCAVVGVPLSWHKTCGRDTLVWVGFESLLRSRYVGISARRAEWFVRWAETVAGSTTIHMGSFEEGLGRIMFVAGALEHERPFLAPLHKFLTMHPRGSIRRVPPYVSFILKYLGT